MIYESYNLLKESPTIGLFFFAADYIHFLKNLRESFAAQLRFISPEESKWKEIPELAGDKRFGCYPIGQLFIKGKTVEIFFLHYHSESEAKAKWERRCKRVNWKHMLTSAFFWKMNSLRNLIFPYCSIVNFSKNLFMLFPSKSTIFEFIIKLHSYYFLKRSKEILETNVCNSNIFIKSN